MSDEIRELREEIAKLRERVAVLERSGIWNSPNRHTGPTHAPMTPLWQWIDPYYTPGLGRLNPTEVTCGVPK